MTTLEESYNGVIDFGPVRSNPPLSQIHATEKPGGPSRHFPPLRISPLLITYANGDPRREDTGNLYENGPCPL